MGAHDFEAVFLNEPLAPKDVIGVRNKNHCLYIHIQAFEFPTKLF